MSTSLVSLVSLVEQRLGLDKCLMQTTESLTSDENHCLSEVSRLLESRFDDTSVLIASIETEKKGHHIVSIGHANKRFVPSDRYGEQTVLSADGHSLLKTFYLEDDGFGGYYVSGYGLLEDVWGVESVGLRYSIDKIGQMLSDPNVWQEQEMPKVKKGSVVTYAF